MTRKEKLAQAKQEYRAGMAKIYADLDAKGKIHRATCPRCVCGREADKFTGLCIMAEMTGHCN